MTTLLIGPITPNELTQRQGYVNKLAQRLYRTVGHDVTMAVICQLNACVELPPKQWKELCERLVPKLLCIPAM